MLRTLALLTADQAQGQSWPRRVFQMCLKCSLDWLGSWGVKQNKTLQAHRSCQFSSRVGKESVQELKWCLTAILVLAGGNSKLLNSDKKDILNSYTPEHRRPNKVRQKKRRVSAQQQQIFVWNKDPLRLEPSLTAGKHLTSWPTTFPFFFPPLCWFTGNWLKLFFI